MSGLSTKRKAGLGLALAILIGMYFVPVPAGLTVAGVRTLGCTLALLVCLSTGALPLGLASLLFMMLYYVLGAASSLNAAISGMATPPVLFILASFGMSAAVSESPISRRILHFMLKLFGKSIRITLLGLMFATAVVSSLISNVPVTAMFVTIGVAFLNLYQDEGERRQTGRAYMIAIPVAAMIGGIMTPVGSSPNLVAISTLQSVTGYQISFIEWMAYGCPLALVLIPLAWMIITRVFPPAELDPSLFKEFVDSTCVREKVGKQEAKVIAVMGVMVILWVLSSWITAINLYVVAVIGVAFMFLPGIQVLDWEAFKKNTNWDVVFVTASVISLGNVIQENGISDWIVDAVFPSELNLPAFAVIFITAVFVILMLLIVPISGALIQILAGPLIAVALNAQVEPSILMITLCVCATNCYLLPIDTVPLLSYSTGYYQMTDMPKATAPILLTLALLCALWFPLVSGLI